MLTVSCAGTVADGPSLGSKGTVNVQSPVVVPYTANRLTSAGASPLLPKETLVIA
jgi:hypothetical protein